MFTNLLKHNLAPLVLRLALGIIFVYHGWGKITKDAGMGWDPTQPVEEALPAYMQLPVAWGEFLGGIALIIGFLTRFAAAGIIIIMAGAIIKVHGAQGFSLQTGGYEYNFALIAMCLAVILLGGGAFSADHLLWRRRQI